MSAGQLHAALALVMAKAPGVASWLTAADVDQIGAALASAEHPQPAVFHALLASVRWAGFDPFHLGMVTGLAMERRDDGLLYDWQALYLTHLIRARLRAVAS